MKASPITRTKVDVEFAFRLQAYRDAAVDLIMGSDSIWLSAVSLIASLILSSAHKVVGRDP
jgi:hypothetical protein